MGQFVSEARGLAGQLPDKAYAINLHSDRYLYLRAFCAAIIAGQCTLMPPNRQPYTLRQLQELYPDSYVIGDGGEEPAAQPAGDASIPDIDDEQLCAVAFTSGSTGKPKSNNKAWRTLRDGTRSNVRLLFGAEHEHFNLVATVPPQHMWGMETSVLMPMFTRVAVSASMPFYPQDIADAIDAVAPPVVLVSSPIHLETLLRSGVKPKGLARVLTATAPLSRELAVKLERGFDTEVQDVFGCSESGILATRATSTEDLWTYADVFDLTSSDAGITIRAAHLLEDVLMPDVVELVGEHQYRWLGRQADMVNIAGKRGSLAEINLRLRELPGVVDGVVFTNDERPDRLAALVVAPDRDVPSILADLKERVEPVFLPRPMYKVDILPRQETGKIAVSAVQALFNDLRASRADRS